MSKGWFIYSLLILVRAAMFRLLRTDDVTRFR